MKLRTDQEKREWVEHQDRIRADGCYSVRVACQRYLRETERDAAIREFLAGLDDLTRGARLLCGEGEQT